MEFKKLFKLELDDYTAFNFFSLRKLFVFLPIMVFGIAFVMFWNNDPERTLIEVAVKALFMAIFIPLFFLYLTNYSAKKTFRTTKFMHLPQEVIVNDTGVHTSGELGTTNISWQFILKVSETKNAVYAYVQKTQAIIIPKRMITPEEAATIRTLVRNNLSTEKNKLKTL